MKKLFSYALLFALLAGFIPAFGVFAVSDFDDTFEGGTLDTGKWSWTREGTWEMNPIRGLRMTTGNTDLFETVATAPLLLQDAPAVTQFEILTEIDFMPVANYQQAGIVVWQDDDNFVQVNYQYADHAEVEIYVEQNNDGHAYFFQIPSAPSYIVLKLQRYETVYTAYYSADNGSSWQIVGQFYDVTLTPAKIGLTAYSASAATGIDALFMNFAVNETAPSPEAWEGWWCTYLPCDIVTSPYNTTGSESSQYWSIDKGLYLVCRHEACARLRDVYYTYEMSLTWTSPNDYGAKNMSMYIQTSLSINHAGVPGTPCGSGVTSSCTGFSSGIIPAEEFPSNPLQAQPPTPIFFGAGYGDSITPYNTQSWTWTVSLSFIPPLADCGSAYMILDQGAEIPIDETLEFPPNTPDIVDDQHQVVVSGESYRVQTLAGPWNDSVNDRYDAAISWDGETYVSLASLIADGALCVDYDPANPQLYSVYLTAESTDFYIRVNDTAGAFADNTNTTPLAYSLSLAIAIGNNGCGDNYSYDENNPILEGYAIGTDSTGNSAVLSGPSDVIVGEYYAIEINTAVMGGTHGPWHDGANPSENRYDLLVTYMTELGNPDERFVVGGGEGSEDATVTCAVGTGDGAIVYFQASQMGLNFRVNETNANWGDNTEDLGFKLYWAQYDYVSALCERTYTIGEVVKTDTIMGNQENGKYVGGSSTISDLTKLMLPGEWYMIETSGGPWSHPGSTQDTSYDLALKGKLLDESLVTQLDPGWQFTDDWLWADCVAQTDDLGHKRIYFQADFPGQFDVDIRVNDTGDWMTNHDSMTYTMYHVVNGKDEDEECTDYSYDPNSMPDNWGTVQGNDANGKYAGPTANVASTEAIGIVVNEGTWYEYSGGPDLYGMQISDDEGVTWQPFATYEGRLCYIDEGNNVYVLWVPYGAYLLRVDSSTFPDNTGFRGWDIYTQSASADCFYGLDPYVIDPFEWIVVNRQAGQGITGQTIGGEEGGLVVGYNYILEIEEGPWSNGDGQDSYDAALSNDNGATWYPMMEHPAIICSGTDALGWHDKVAWTVANGEKWMIRVNDSAGNFADNGGNLAYNLSTSLKDVCDTPEENCPPNGDGTGNGNIFSCDVACVKPELTLSVQDWIDFARCSVQSYFAWCKDNTDTVKGYQTEFTTVEPFGTITQVQTLIDATQNEIDAYDWTGSVYENGVLIDGNGTGNQPTPGTDGGDIVGHILPILPANSPWNGGPVVSWSWGAASNLYSTSCTLALSDYIGPTASQGVCWVSNIANENSLLYFVQLIIDISAIFMFLGYFVGMFIDLAAWIGLASSN
jgi:regulation of enolase protein 1 (concanavalin A-like superfamily)